MDAMDEMDGGCPPLPRGERKRSGLSDESDGSDQSDLRLPFRRRVRKIEHEDDGGKTSGRHAGLRRSSRGAWRRTERTWACHRIRRSVPAN